MFCPRGCFLMVGMLAPLRRAFHPLALSVRPLIYPLSSAFNRLHAVHGVSRHKIKRPENRNFICQRAFTQPVPSILPLFALSITRENNSNPSFLILFIISILYLYIYILYSIQRNGVTAHPHGRTAHCAAKHTVRNSPSATGRAMGRTNGF